MSASQIINLAKSFANIDEETIKEIDRIMEKYGYDIFDVIATLINLAGVLYILVQIFPLLKDLVSVMAKEKHE